MKKEIKLVAIVLVALIVFLSGFGMGATKGINFNLNGNFKVENVGGQQAVAPTQTQTPAPAPTEAPTTPGATEAPTTPGATEAPTTPGATEAPSSSAIPSTPAEVAAKYNEVVNALKQEQNVTIHKVEDVVVNLTDCSISAATGLLNPIIAGLVKPADVVFEIVDGVNASDDNRTANNYIYPAKRNAEVSADGLAVATAAPEGDGYKMTLKFKEEKATFDGTTSTEPTFHKGAMDPLNLGTLDISPATINSAEMTYTGADVTCTVNGDGKVTQLHVYLPMAGGGNGGISFFKVELQIEGHMDTTFDITY